MKNIIYSKLFTKQVKKIDQKILKQLTKKIEIFSKNEFDPILNNHKLYSPFEQHRSINITGDFRLLYIKISDDTFLFDQIGTHSELYE
jgi:addiction module RelE/StbE family toxin